MEHGVTINRPPRDGRMAFVRSPDNISVELLQRGEALQPAEPWVSMPNTESGSGMPERRRTREHRRLRPRAARPAGRAV